MIVVEVAAFVPVVFCVLDEGAVKFASAGQLAVTVQVPLELIIVIVAVELEGASPTVPVVQTLLVPVMEGIVLAFVEAVTLKDVPYPALDGAPVKATVGAILVVVVVWVIGPAEV